MLETETETDDGDGDGWRRRILETDDGDGYFFCLLDIKNLRKI